MKTYEPIFIKKVKPKKEKEEPMIEILMVYASIFGLGAMMLFLGAVL